MAINLRDYQEKAVREMKNGCILCGGVGSGKSRTALAYYFKECGGGWTDNSYQPMTHPRDIYIITTARKRDTCEWEQELIPFLISKDPELSYYKDLNVVIDSWNNIKKYKDVYGAFFIFDEQRVVGSGAWVKAFYNITRKNKWILLSATPGDTWSDYIPVFIANGFYKNKTEFQREHIIYSRFTKYPKIDRYINTKRLIRQRDSILVDMDFERGTVSHHEDIFVSYDIQKYKDVTRNRWNPYKDAPIETAAELCYTWRKIVNSDDSRQAVLLELFEKHPRMIVFYNFDYELDILRNIYYGEDVEIAEWNGHKHQPIPESIRWVYLVQYTAGAEGWNCIKTDTIVFYSQNYSYKILEQARGRIDRMNTPFKDLYYYHIKSKAPIDLGISRALTGKKQFNEGKFVSKRGGVLERSVSDDKIAELISRRRRQVLVHSIIYYRMNENIISDAQWTSWANELDELQKRYPDIASTCPLADAFSDFDPSTGFNLPLDDPWAVNKAQQLVRIDRERQIA